MDVYKVKTTLSAENDIRDIVRYISSELNAPTAALNIAQALRKAISGLKTNALFYPAGYCFSFSIASSTDRSISLAFISNA
jgi:plasmid stabilization system protein ParE